MPRHRSRRGYYKLAKRYSNETFTAEGSVVAGPAPPPLNIVLTKSTDILGTRKAKNFTLSLLTNSNVPLVFALVFVPEGTIPSSIAVGNEIEGDSPKYLLSASTYNPNQNVILTGIVGGQSSTVERFKTRLARNLNSGDRIILVIQPLGASEEDYNILACLNYAIAY